jgi:DNA-binding transcriptional regulator YhcF (GntR family)
VVDLVASGELVAGDRLPPVRTLAGELGLAVNTVARAYRELEASGVIETRGRAGSFVTGDDVQRRAKQAATEYADTVRALGLSPEDALALVARALGR